MLNKQFDSKIDSFIFYPEIYFGYFNYYEVLQYFVDIVTLGSFTGKAYKMPTVTPIQGPIFLKNGSVPVVPLFSYPTLRNGSFMQIPVRINNNRYQYTIICYFL